MKIFANVILFLFWFLSGHSQDTAIRISSNMILSEEKVIPLHTLPGWIYKKGNDTNWAKKDIDITGWEKRKVPELSEKLADKDGKLECWLRIKIEIDTVFRNTQFDLLVQTWGAADVYVDGILLASFGNTGANGEPFKEHNPNQKLPLAFPIQVGNEHLLAIHFVDFVSPFPPHHLKSDEMLDYFMALALPGKNESFVKWTLKRNFYKTTWLSVNVILCLLFWLLAFQNPKEKNIVLIGLASTCLSITAFINIFLDNPAISNTIFKLSQLGGGMMTSLAIVFALLLISRIFRHRVTKLLKVCLLIIFTCSIAPLFLYESFLGIVQIPLSMLIALYYTITSWKTLKGAQWAIVTGIVIAIFCGLLTVIPRLLSTSTFLIINTIIYFSFPLSLLVYVAMRFKEIIREVQLNAQQVVELSEEKKQQALNQQKILQEEVNRQTAELRHTLDNLKSTQAQLIQSEKMASLGELTAGIAHEIQNPLNFVNNFSEVNKELLEELRGERHRAEGERNTAIEDEILDDIEQNLEKINHHGKRADAIVKGMLQHSKTSTGIKEPTDINKLADEYLRLSYHGMRAKDKDFNAEIKTDFDDNIGRINVVPQDIGRVLLNLYNNAFYAVNERCKAEGVRPKVEGSTMEVERGSYVPTVTAVTKKANDKIEIKVTDNGTGIPQNIVDKIFQPFFTTKPTGQGTGLGLSLAYDIIKTHGGEIKVATKEGEGSEFIIMLPA